MPLTLSWQTVVLRLLLTLLAGGILGINRGEQARPAGLRTTVLVCLAASAAMIQVNLLLVMAQERQSMVTLDLMRLPLGILSGIGFIGGGAIIKRGDIVHGVTTAATLWFATVMGLCFGGGQLVLGGELLVLVLFVLWALKWVEERFIEDRRATLTVRLRGGGSSEDDLRALRTRARFRIARCALDRSAAGARLVSLDVQWRPDGEAGRVPPVVDQIASLAGVSRLKWDSK